VSASGLPRTVGLNRRNGGTTSDMVSVTLATHNGSPNGSPYVAVPIKSCQGQSHNFWLVRPQHRTFEFDGVETGSIFGDVD
jgi:hypothetical protein